VIEPAHAPSDPQLTAHLPARHATAFWHEPFPEQSMLHWVAAPHMMSPPHEPLAEQVTLHVPVLHISPPAQELCPVQVIAQLGVEPQSTPPAHDPEPRQSTRHEVAAPQLTVPPQAPIGHETLQGIPAGQVQAVVQLIRQTPPAHPLLQTAGHMAASSGLPSTTLRSTTFESTTLSSSFLRSTTRTLSALARSAADPSRR
jgi:hypothetical protein